MTNALARTLPTLAAPREALRLALRACGKECARRGARKLQVEWSAPVLRVWTDGLDHHLDRKIARHLEGWCNDLYTMPSVLRLQNICFDFDRRISAHDQPLSAPDPVPAFRRFEKRLLAALRSHPETAGIDLAGTLLIFSIAVEGCFLLLRRPDDGGNGTLVMAIDRFWELGEELWSDLGSFLDRMHYFSLAAGFPGDTAHERLALAKAIKDALDFEKSLGGETSPDARPGAAR